MAYRYGDRYQMALFPQSIEEYVSKDDPVRAYDAFVEALDFRRLGIILDENKIGNSEYNPKAMIKLLLYGYSYGLRSSRQLERAAHHNLSFIWLLEGLKPDHKTIANFRRNNRKALKEILKQCARMCIELGLIDGNTLFVDSTRIRANASIKNTYNLDKCQRHLKKIDERIETILSECDKIDQREENQASWVKLNKELQDKEVLKCKIQNVLGELKLEKKASINTTDRDSTKINFPTCTHAGYSSHIVTDEKHGLITSADVVNENEDSNQFANQINQANKVLGKKCATACADAGYSHAADLKQIDQQGIKVIVPTQRQALKEPPKQPNHFDKSNFLYDKGKDCYICPEGYTLQYKCSVRHRGYKEYVVSRGKNNPCKSCSNFGICTKSQSGRKITRLLDEEVKEKLEALFVQPDSQAIYRLRKQRIEHPFGHVKRNLGMNAFLMRGLEGVKAEMSLLASCFNIRRMLTILGGVGPLIRQLRGQKETIVNPLRPVEALI